MEPWGKKQKTVIEIDDEMLTHVDPTLTGGLFSFRLKCTEPHIKGTRGSEDQS